MSTSRLLLFTSLFAMTLFAQSNRFVMDGHVHMINRQFYLGGDISDSYKDGQVDLPRIRKGGLSAIFFSLFSQEAYYTNRYETKQTLRLMDLALRQIQKNHDQIEIAYTASDVERIHKAGKIGAFLDLEGGFDLDGDLNVLRDMYRLGLRSAMLVAHNYTNEFADSCCAMARWHGINAKGRTVIREMNRLGMVINVAHGSDETIQQTVEASSDPVLYSHGGSRAIVDTGRNITDEAARKLAAKGGVIGVQFGNTFNNPKYYASVQKGRPYGNFAPSPAFFSHPESIEDVDRQVAKAYPDHALELPDEIRMPVDQLLVTINHWIGVVGEDHVSLGSDFDGGPPLPKGMHDISDYQQVIAAMQERGWSEERIRKVAGLNLLRLIRQVTEKRR
jgi:membrane dipeptidase